MDSTTIVYAEPFIELLLPFIQAIVLGVLVPVAVAFFLKKLNLDMEAQHRDALQTSLTNAAGLLIQKGAAQAGKLTVDVKSAQMAAAIRYVQDSAPDAVKRWGLTPEAIAEKVRAKLPQVEPAIPAPTVPSLDALSPRA